MKLAKIALGIVAGALLLVGGAMSVETNIAVDQATSTFTKSTFDYLIESPDKDQLKEYAANTEAVESIFPVHHYEIALASSSSAKLHLLLSDKMADYDISFFNPNRVVKGQYKEDGLMLDEVAAQQIGAQVGSQVSFTLGASKYTLEVSSIYGAVNYSGMSTGIAMAKFTTAMANSWGEGKGPSLYGFAFLAAKNKVKCAEMLQDYIPWGRLGTYEEYKEVQDKSRTPADGDDAAWEEKVRASWEARKETFKKQEFVKSVQDKETIMEAAADTVATRKDRGLQLTLLFSIRVPLGLAGGLIAFDFLGRKRDEAEKINGKTKGILCKNIIIFDLISVGAAVVVSLAGILIWSVVRDHFFVDSILLYSLPALAALAIAIPIGLVYAGLVYGENKPKAIAEVGEEATPAIEEAPAIEAPTEEPTDVDKPEE